MRRPRADSLSLVYFGVGLLIGVMAAVVLRTVYHAANTSEARLLFPDTAPQYLEETGNPLDFAINGPGFFAFEDKEGNWVFSRESRLVINEDGELASPYGYRMAIRGRPAGVAAAPKSNTKINPDNIYIDKINMAWEVFSASKTARAFQSIRLYYFPSEKNYVWGGDHFWFGRPPGETPLVTPMKVSRIEPQIFQGYRLRPDPPPGEKTPFNVNGPYHNGPKDILNEKTIQTDRKLDYGIAGEGFVALDLSSPMNSSQQVISNSGIGFTRWLSLEENEDGVLERKYPGQLVTVQSSSPPKAPRRSLSSIASILPPVPPTVQRTQYIKSNVPILQSVQNASAQPDSPDAFKLPDGFVKPSVGYSIFDEDLMSKWVENSTVLSARKQYVTRETIHSIVLYRFANPENLHYIRNGVYTANDLSGPPIAIPNEKTKKMLLQGSLNEVERLKP